MSLSRLKSATSSFDHPFFILQLPQPPRLSYAHGGTDAMGEGLEQLAAQIPAVRPATADEIAEAIVFLATGSF
jgi:hypothetical protein